MILHPSKKIIIAFISFFTLFFFPLFANEESTDNQDEAEDDEIASMFDTAEDYEEPVVTEEVNAGTNYDVSIGTLKFPIEVSGKMTAELGLAYIWKDSEKDGSAYFDFKNYINFVTRPDKYLALKGTVKTSLPACSDSLDGQTNYLYIYEFYFDYLMFDKVYITAGKKNTVWGNIRLFSDSKAYENDTDALATNIMYDSREHMSGIIKIPFWNHTFTGIGMYRGGTGDSVGTRDMSFAFLSEFVFWKTSFNLYGRRFPLADSEVVEKDSSLHQKSVVGMELKRTIFNFDLYGQTLGRISEDESKSPKDIFSSYFSDLSYFDKIISTVGCYRMWNDNTPYVGFNIEFQNIYVPEPDDTQKFFTNRFACYFGVAKLGPNKDIAIGVQWNHNITEKIGFIKPGLNISRILPHCDWRFGAKYEYGYDKATQGYGSKLTIGTYITISMDY